MPKSKKRTKSFIGYRPKFHYQKGSRSENNTHRSEFTVHVDTSSETATSSDRTDADLVSEKVDVSHSSADVEQFLDAYPDGHSHEYCLDSFSFSAERDSNDSAISVDDQSVLDESILLQDHSNTNIQHQHDLLEDSAIDLDISSCAEDLDSSASEPVVNEPVNSYESLKEKLTEVIEAPFVMNTTNGDIRILEIYNSGSKSIVKLVVLIHADYTATISVHQREIPSTHDLWNGMPPIFDSTSKILLLLTKLQTFSVCIGNTDEEFQSLVPVGAGISDGEDHGLIPGQVLAYREGDFCASQGNITYHSTIRSSQCSMLIYQRSRCANCSSFRRNLRRRKQNLQGKENKLLSANYRHSNMTTEMLKAKLHEQKKKIRSLQNELDTLKRRFDREILKKGVSFNDAQNIEMSDLVSSCSGDMQNAYVDPNCLQRLFWDQQRKFNSSGKNGMRWHPMIIKWCLYLRHRSAKAYEAMRDGGFINLPSARTLFDYSHYTKSTIGYSTDVVKVLKEEASKRNMYSEDESWRGYVGVLFDELKIKEDLVYDKHSGELVGYCDLDSVGNKFMELEKCLNVSADKTTDIAKYVMIVMVRAVTTDLKFPLAAFATKSITADFLYPILWKAIHILENINLKVLFLTCDGASANRRFFKLHTLNGHDFVHYTDNPYDSSRKIFFVSDVPHLLKTTRNCFSNSFSHRMSRQLWKDEKNISWMHIVKLYEEHCEFSLYTPCPELSRAHVDLTAFTCMKVKLAAQVMSDSVANALEELYDGQVSETVTFIRNINKFFDCLNVRNRFEGRNKRNPNLAPYMQTDDERLDWLQQDFLGYLDTWKHKVHNRPGNFSASQKASMLLSYQTLEGLRISVKSITECVRLMLNEGAQFILTHAFNQDPLEEHFGHHRNKGGANDNPTVYDVRNALTQIRSVNVHAFAPRNGNVLQNQQIVNIDNSSLPKRKVNRN
ncbi:uncharacterized protein LOC117326894 [Pecten maximus]|uniref:uncharacterized protein LOC117326894 n=1 Tax=Pecten maximus TaxID=6579 RepID=UPI001457F12D|nr:uncharacterized protein LOC117326894 [Pecten maximus]